MSLSVFDHCQTPTNLPSGPRAWGRNARADLRCALAEDPVAKRLDAAFGNAVEAVRPTPDQPGAFRMASVIAGRA